MFARAIWRADEKAGVVRAPGMPALVPEVVVEEPVVTRKSKRTGSVPPPEVVVEEPVVTRKPKKGAHEETG